jgi:GrpB-like predicted nucleotidyltransferase (UPF0157 family)
VEPELRKRLIEVGVNPDRIDDPSRVWALLHERFGAKTTVLDRYEIEARRLGVDPGELPESVRHRLADEVLAAQSPGIELIGASSRDPIQVVAYDPGWAETYAAWETQLAAALGQEATSIDHIGSTSVARLVAKPIIDILIGVGEPEDESRYVPAIEGTGVLLRSREDDHRYFRPAPGQPRTVHIHVCRAFGRWATDHILFRDYLRSSAEARNRYAVLKLELANRYRNDRPAYTDAKSGFILDTLETARRWAAATGWQLPPRR